MEYEDKELVSKYLQGDETSLSILVEKYSKLVYNFIYRLTGNKEEAFDITQETFLKIWKNLKKYNPEKNFKTWIMTIARNSAIDWLRKKRLIMFSSLDNPETGETFEENLADDSPLAPELFQKNEIKTLIEDTLQKISLDQRMVIILHDMEGLTFEEIAKEVKKPPNTVKSHYRRGLKAMKNALNAPN